MFHLDNQFSLLWQSFARYSLCLSGNHSIDNVMIFRIFFVFGKLKNLGQRKTNHLVNGKHSSFCSTSFTLLFSRRQATEKWLSTPHHILAPTLSRSLSLVSSAPSPPFPLFTHVSHRQPYPILYLNYRQIYTLIYCLCGFFFFLSKFCFFVFLFFYDGGHKFSSWIWNGYCACVVSVLWW